MKGSNNQVPLDEGFEVFDGDGEDLDVDYDEELEGRNIENDNVNTKEPTDLVLLRKINGIALKTSRNNVQNHCHCCI